jgi:inosine/xanthosine triphosphate pyrophosphatase family protein
MKELFLGTTNPAKVHIVRASVESLPVKIVTPDDLRLQVEVQEDGRSTAENAEIKARTFFAVVHMPTLAIDGGLHIEGFAAEKQPGVFVRRIYGRDRAVTDEEVLDYYVRELENVGGESMGLWRGSMVLVISDDQIFADSFSFKTILTSWKKGGVTPGAPLDALTIEPTTGRYFSEMAWKERPDAQWVFEFVKRHLDTL